MDNTVDIQYVENLPRLSILWNPCLTAKKRMLIEETLIVVIESVAV